MEDLQQIYGLGVDDSTGSIEAVGDSDTFNTAECHPTTNYPKEFKVLKRAPTGIVMKDNCFPLEVL